MLKVRCKMCEHEVNGYCQKKRQATKPVKVRLNKPRSCSLYSEDALRVLTDYRKREAHKKNLVAMEQQRIAIAKVLFEAQADLEARKQEIKNEDL